MRLHRLFQSTKYHTNEIINVDQNPSKFVPTDNITMAEKGTKNIARKGGSDKRGITVTFRDSEW